MVSFFSFLITLIIGMVVGLFLLGGIIIVLGAVLGALTAVVVFLSAVFSK